MPDRIFLAMYPPRFIHGGIRFRPRNARRANRGKGFEDERMRDSQREHERDLEREGR